MPKVHLSPRECASHTHSWPPRTRKQQKNLYTSVREREIIEVNVACNKSVVLFSPNLFSFLPLALFLLLFTSKHRRGLYQPRIIMNNGKRYHIAESFHFASRAMRGLAEFYYREFYYPNIFSKFYLVSWSRMAIKNCG
jgi:hypothetical protein